jgi:hypothetical protein
VGPGGGRQSPGALSPLRLRGISERSTDVKEGGMQMSAVVRPYFDANGRDHHAAALGKTRTHALQLQICHY